MGQDGTALPASVSRVRIRIERWREHGVNRWRMPEELWAAAVFLARSHGIAPIARALRLDYGSLKKRVERSPENEAGDRDRISRFVEIDPRHLVPGPERSGATVELLDVEGTKLLIRLSDRESLDVPALVAAFRQHRS